MKQMLLIAVLLIVPIRYFQSCVSTTSRSNSNDKDMQVQLATEMNSIKLKFNQNVLDTLNLYKVDLNELILSQFIPKLKSTLKSKFPEKPGKLSDLPFYPTLLKYFGESKLSRVRFIAVKELPTFKELLTDAGIDRPRLKLYKVEILEKTWKARMKAITIGELIYINKEDLDDASVFFHECVHVTQNEKLGTDKFLSMLFYSLLSGVSYEEIPFEKMALYLQSKFESNDLFDADDFVRKVL